MVNEEAVRRQICEVGRRLWEVGLVGAKEGNISARFGQDRVLCTPSGARKGDLEPDDLVMIDLNGTPIGGGVPSSEYRIHLRAYQCRPDCRAVVHAHPLAATALSLAGLTIPPDTLPECDLVLGKVAMVPFGYPGTDALPDQLAPYLHEHNTFVLSHHGAMTLGGHCWDACDRMETLERISRVITLARQLGSIQPLPESDAQRLRSERESVGVVL